MRWISLPALALALCACSDTDHRLSGADVSRGNQLYVVHCASCHGVKLEGQAHWRDRLPNGKLPAPPHDVSGHTWHHSDGLLFLITKNGMAPYAPAGYASDMPAFGDRLSDDEIGAILTYIKSTWPNETRRHQAEVSRQDRR